MLNFLYCTTFFVIQWPVLSVIIGSDNVTIYNMPHIFSVFWYFYPFQFKKIYIYLFMIGDRRAAKVKQIWQRAQLKINSLVG